MSREIAGLLLIYNSLVIFVRVGQRVWISFRRVVVSPAIIRLEDDEWTAQ